MTKREKEMAQLVRAIASMDGWLSKQSRPKSTQAEIGKRIRRHFLDLPANGLAGSIPIKEWPMFTKPSARLKARMDKLFPDLRDKWRDVEDARGKRSK